MAIAASTRHRELFQQMVEASLSEKEELERQRAAPNECMTSLVKLIVVGRNDKTS